MHTNAICIDAQMHYVRYVYIFRYGVATISRLQIIGLFCKRVLQKRRHSAKETYNFKEPTNCSHAIYAYVPIHI